MQKRRALAEAGRAGLYHVCSRVVDRRVIFGDQERRVFMRMIKGGGAFAGVDLVSWCLMGNHFHLLVRVPPADADALSDEEVFARMEHIYPEVRMRHFRGVWERMGNEDSRRAFLAPFRARMGVLSEFVKTLKQRFSQWFNRKNDREGTLWEGRFWSVMLSHNEKDDGQGLGLLARFVAGYIDLNPVRAGLAVDAGDCDWSSYGAALRGDAEAQHGLRLLHGKFAGGASDCSEGGFDESALLGVHGQLLARARFIDRLVGREKWCDSMRGGSSGVFGPQRAGGRSVPGAEKWGRSLEREDACSGGALRREAGDESPSSGVGRELVEARLLQRMGERCVDLTKGRVLGEAWVVGFAG